MKKRMLALLLTLAMVLSLSVVAFADDGINTADELKGAIDNGGEIVVTGDITLNEAITITKDVTIKADSAVTITTNKIDVFKVTSGGKLTIGKNITVNSTVGAILEADGGEIVVNGKLNATNTDSVATVFAKNNGKITIGETGEVTSTQQGGYNATAKTGATVTIDGKVVSEVGCAAQANGGYLIINDGATVTTNENVAGKTAVYAANNGVVTVNGGNISSAKGYTLCAVANGTINVAGGTVNNGAIAYEGANAKINISGGTVNGGLRADEGLGTITVTGGTFSSLSVLDYLGENADITVKLNDNVTLDEAVTISDSVTLTADKAVTITTNKIDVFRVTSGGKLTIGKNITVNSTVGAILEADGGEIVVNGKLNATNTDSYATVFAKNNGKITIGETGEVTSTQQGGYNATAKTGATVTINGKVVSDAGCAAQANGGYLIINDGATVTTNENVAGKTAVYAANNGVVTVNGGNISSAKGYTLCAVANGTINVAGGTVNRGAIAYEGANAKINISGGTVNGGLRADEGLGTITITGGTFDTDVSAYLAEGAVLVNGTVSRVEFWGNDLQLANTLNMAFYIDKDQKNDWKGCYAVVEMNNAECVYYFDDDAWLTDQTEEYYYIYFTGIYAYMMDEEITVAIYNSDETQISETFKTSVAQYANAMKSADSAKYGTIVDALLAYGAAAKSFFSASAN